MEIKNNTENKTTNPINFPDNINIAFIGDTILFYASILTFLIGIAGNIISILIFIKPCLNNRTNTGLLYTLLCALNLIVLLFNVFVKRSNIIFHYNIRLHLTSEYFIDAILLQYLSWFQVIITFDRFIAVIFPVKGVRIMSKRWVLYSIILGIFIATVGFNSFLLIRKRISKPIYLYMQIFKILMKVIIPYLIMTILNFIVIIRLRKQKHKSNLSQNQTIQVNSINKSWRFTRNTILIDLIYLIFNLPATVFETYFIYIYLSMVVEHPYFLLIFYSLSLSQYIYSSSLFILFICFNKIFRAEFIALISQQRFFILIKKLFV